MDDRKEKRRLHLREVSLRQDDRDTLGAILREARLSRGEEAADVASKLKMRRDQLAAIEENDFARLPGRTYAIGFVRAYARYLGLDSEEIVQRLKERHAAEDAVKPVQLEFLEPLQEQSVPKGSIVILALVIAMVIYSIVYLTLPTRKGTTAANAATPAVIIEQPQAVLPKPAVIAPNTTRQAAGNEQTAPSFVGGTQPIPESALPKPLANFTFSDAQDVASTLTLAQSEPFPTESTTTTPQAELLASAGESRITLRALAPTYVQIRDTTQKAGRGILIGRVLNVGESFRAPDRAGLVMQTGNAGGLEVEVDGRTVGILGKSGEVITRIPVDPSYFLERVAASQ
jgi:cytoskeleton protein RodZ